MLIGGGGADTFVFTSGNGTDLIMDFSANDTIRLNGYGVTSFDQLVNNATQQGNDLWLNFSNGEAVVLAGTTVGDLQADQFELSLDRSSFTQTLPMNSTRCRRAAAVRVSGMPNIGGRRKREVR